MKKVIALLSSLSLGISGIANINLATNTNKKTSKVEKLYSENWTDELNSYIILNKTTTKYFNKKVGISYAGYSNLNDFLDSNDTFDLGIRFESRIGVLPKYKKYNDTFNKDENTKILKPYINKWVKITEIDWSNSLDTSNHSSAEIEMSINDDSQSKIIFFNFKSTLSAWKTWDAAYNYMY